MESRPRISRKPSGMRRAVISLVGLFIIVPECLPAAPDDAQEVPITVTGKVKVIQIDKPDDGGRDQGQLIYLLEEQGTHKEFTLRFTDKQPARLRSGMVVTARGKAKGQELLLAADGNNQQSITVNSSPSSVVAGDQKTLVIVANLADSSVTCSTDSIRNLMFGSPTSSVDGLYRETSYGAISLSGQVAGPYLLNYNSSTCDSTAWADAADAAARAEGIDLGSYNRKVYVMPNTCSVGGIGE